MDRICTSHIERNNLHIRMTIRRMTRLTNAFSKKLENHEAMIALAIGLLQFLLEAWYAGDIASSRGRTDGSHLDGSGTAGECG